MPRDGGGKGKGKGKGNGKDGGGGGGNDKPTAWQCKDCQSLWNPRGATFCGGCGKPRESAKNSSVLTNLSKSTKDSKSKIERS